MIFFQYDDGFDGLAAVGVVGSNDAAFANGRVLVHHRLNFCGPDFVATGVNHAFQAIGKKEKAFIVDVAKIA